MKKSTKFLTILLAVLMTVSFSSCELFNRVKEELIGPTNKWLRYEYEYEMESGQKVKLFCYLIYAENYSNNEMELPNDSTRFPNGKLKTGLTVVVTPKIDTVEEQNLAVNLFGCAMDYKYVIKTFPENEYVDLAVVNSSDKKFKMGKATWAVIYNSIELNNTQLPTAIRDDSSYTELTDLNSFNFKKLMAGMALNYLTDYLED